MIIGQPSQSRHKACVRPLRRRHSTCRESSATSGSCAGEGGGGCCRAELDWTSLWAPSPRRS
eukprot:3953509-Amphidinium_carterae.1